MMVQILGNSPNIMSTLLKEKALNLLKCVLCALDLKYIYYSHKENNRSLLKKKFLREYSSD